MPYIRRTTNHDQWWNERRKTWGAAADATEFIGAAMAAFDLGSEGEWRTSPTEPDPIAALGSYLATNQED
jgi:hypothetical protein